MTIEVSASRERTRVPGAITSAMRTARPREGKRIARLARIENGRIVDEWLKAGDAKFAGGSLIRTGDGYVLELDVGVSARVAGDLGAQTVTGPCRVPLGDDARGKIVCGNVAHLFQLVVEAPKSKPQLPVTAVARGEGIDWPFAILVAISLLAHFGFASASQADWFDPVVDDARDAAGLISEAQARPQLPVEEQKPSDEGAPRDEKPTTQATSKGPVATAKPKPAGNNLSALGNTLDDLGLATLGSLQKGGPAKSKLLTEGSAVDGVLDELAKKQGGVDPDGPKMKGDPGGGGPIGPEKPGIVFGDTKGNTKPVDDMPKDEPTVPVKVNDPVISPPVGAPSDVNAVIAKNRWKLKACYSKELVTNGDAEGTVYATVTVSAEGDVIDASAASSQLSSAMNACVAGAFRTMHFAPSEGKSTFKVPVLYTKPGK